LPGVDFRRCSSAASFCVVLALLLLDDSSEFLTRGLPFLRDDHAHSPNEVRDAVLAPVALRLPFL
jgi:hypothetical protein